MEALDRQAKVAPALQRPIDNSYATAELLAYMALGKYWYQILLYWQKKMSAHWGQEPSLKRMADLIEAIAYWFKPIYGCMREKLIASGYLQANGNARGAEMV